MYAIFRLENVTGASAREKNHKISGERGRVGAVRLWVEGGQQQNLLATPFYKDAREGEKSFPYE